jgi:ribosomal protein L11 methyltransferase
MRAWPAIDVDFSRAAEGRPDLFLAALVDYDVAAIDETAEYRVFFHAADARDRALAALRAEFADLSLHAVDVPDDDWAARSQASLRAIRVGGIVVAPPWDVPDVGRGGTPDLAGREGPPCVVIIQPSMGFGTGHHATTRLCLQALQELDLRGRTVLDVGTGSGVLAIAAQKLGAARSVGIDDDADAIHAARENVALNRGVAVELHVLDLRATTPSPFDVVLANLTGALLLATAGRLQESTRTRGALILSGFMQHEEAEVLAAFTRMRLVDRRQEDEWVCVTLRNRGLFE